MDCVDIRALMGRMFDSVITNFDHSKMFGMNVGGLAIGRKRGIHFFLANFNAYPHIIFPLPILFNFHFLSAYFSFGGFQSCPGAKQI